MSIQILSDQTIAQIAAGEVVERPTSVVKELLENAIDAGASNIHVAVNAAGKKLIRLSDNGMGIRADEVELAFARHATSKLQSITDLEHIKTLGFRGEALSSIAAVSRVTVVSRARDETNGVQCKIEGGKILQRQPIGAPIGTVISVENLFYNTPARLKFLRKENTEKRHILNIVSRYAMAYPGIRFALENEGREVFRSHGGGDLADVVVRAYGLDNFRNMVEVYAEEMIRHGTNVTVQGYTSTPHFHRSDRGAITLFVNGRWIQDVSLSYAVVQAYHMLLEPGRYPAAVLMINLPSEDVDVNVHPTKAEIRFRDENIVFSAVQRAVRQAVVAVARPEFRSEGYRTFGSASQRSSGRWLNDFISQNPLDLSIEANDEENASMPSKVELGNVSGDDLAPADIPFGPDTPLKPRTLPMLRVIGQIGAMYIIAEGPAGMYLIDQNAAHMRVLYEQLVDLLEVQRSIPCLSFEAKMVDLKIHEVALLEDNLSLLNTLGINLEAFGQSSFIVRTIPEILRSLDPSEVIYGIVNQLLNIVKNRHHDAKEAILTAIAQMGAVRAGQILGVEEMQSLVRQLERCRNPLKAPTGIVTLLHMSGEQIAREFSRQ